jgi:hypothetical protein
VRAHVHEIARRSLDHLGRAFVALRAPQAPAGPRPEHRSVVDTPYGRILAVLDDDGKVSVSGLGFQGSIEAPDGSVHVLKGTLDRRRADHAPVSVEEIFAPRTGQSYQWRALAPDLAPAFDAILSDPDFVRAMEAREAYDFAMRQVRRHEETRERLREEVLRATLLSNALFAEETFAPSP